MENKKTVYYHNQPYIEITEHCILDEPDKNPLIEVAKKSDDIKFVLFKTRYYWHTLIELHYRQGNYHAESGARQNWFEIQQIISDLDLEEEYIKYVQRIEEENL